MERTLAMMDRRDTVPHIMPPEIDPSIILPLAPTLAALPDEPRRGLARLAEAGFRYVQLSATQPGVRPRELDQSARRDLAATLRRNELIAAGIDLWIPPHHFADSAHVDRVLHAAMEAVALAAVLGRCPVSLTLPGESAAGDTATINESVLSQAIDALREAAHRQDVPIADHAVPPNVTERSSAADEMIGIGIDPAMWLAAGSDPIKAVHQWAGAIRAARLVDLTAAAVRCPVGQPDGRLNVRDYRVALSTSGFPGPLVLDGRQWREPWEGMLHSARLWQRG